MDLNGDGFNDILSGCYSRSGQDMAGIFQVFHGDKDGNFAAVQKVSGDDGKPLVIPAGQDVIEKICTRPTAADLDGDGKLDLVVGNFGGHFYLFKGLGKGGFEAKPSQMNLKNGQAIKVDHHSDPFLVDWDRDGDLDLVSGSNGGGVFLFRNSGDKKAWAFESMETLIPAVGYKPTAMRFGEDHIRGPRTATRVYIDDVNEDGKWDILIGDSVSIYEPAGGLSPKEALAKHAEFTKERDALMEKDSEKVDWQKMFKREQEIIKTDSTGFVWIYYQN